MIKLDPFSIMFVIASIRQVALAAEDTLVTSQQLATLDIRKKDNT